MSKTNKQFKKHENKEEIDEVFEKITHKLNEHDIPWWVTGGSMLGCYRDGKRIEWDHDYDIAYPIEYAPSVLEALLEMPNLFINYNLLFRVDKLTDLKIGKHFICVKPHIFTNNGVFKVTTPLRKLVTKLNKKGFYTIPEGLILLINKLLRKLPILIQKTIIKLNMNTYILSRYRGPLEEYSSWEQAKMGDVDVKLPVGVESILERLYGEDFMTPKRKGEFEYGGNLDDYPDP